MEENNLKHRLFKWETEVGPSLLTIVFPPRISQKLIELDIPVEDFLLEKIRNENMWLLLTGEVGTGKTLLACRYMEESMKKSYLYNKGFSARDGHIYINTSDMLMNIRQAIGAKDDEMHNAILLYYDIPLLIIDDLGMSKLTEWGLDVLQGLVEHRYNHNKPIIFTSNYSGNELAFRVGHRIMSRMVEMATVIELEKIVRPELPKFKRTK